MASWKRSIATCGGCQRGNGRTSATSGEAQHKPMPWESLGNEIAILIPDHPCRCGQTIEVGSERARSPAALVQIKQSRLTSQISPASSHRPSSSGRVIARNLCLNSLLRLWSDPIGVLVALSCCGATPCRRTPSRRPRDLGCKARLTGRDVLTNQLRRTIGHRSRGTATAVHLSALA